ncbi:MAG: J domain-containing protein [Saprospiraceae bacterium]
MKDYHYILGVEKGATKKEIKTAFRKLSKKFHPDLNDGDKYFEERFKDIREAYEALMNDNYQKTDNTKQEKPVIIDFSISKDKVSPGENATLSWKVINAEKVNINILGDVTFSGQRIITFTSEYKLAQSKITITATGKSEQVNKTLTVLIKNDKITTPKNFSFLRTAAIVLISFGVLYWFVIKPDTTEYSSNQPTYTPVQNNYPVTEEAPKQSKYQEAEENTAKKSVSKSSEMPIPKKYNLNYFTIGSSRSDVIDLQGTPTRIRKYGSTETLSYGLSSVEIKNGVVAEYNNFDKNLKIQVNSNTKSSLNYFTIGSSRSDVIDLQGTPTKIRKYGSTETLSYGLSSVEIENGIVVEYNNFDKNLKVK